MKSRKHLFQGGLFLIPFAAAIISEVKSSILMSVAAIVAALTLVLILPLCKGRENLWAFPTMNIISLPLNIKLINTFLSFIGYTPFENSFISVLFFLSLFILMSVESILIGVFVRIIKPRQIYFDD